MSISRLNTLCALLVPALMLVCSGAHAQDTDSGELPPPKYSQLHPLQYDIFVYASGSFKTHDNLWTATNTVDIDKVTRDTYINLGVEAEAYTAQTLKLNASLGYKYERYGYKAGFSTNDGILTHWLSPAVSLRSSFIGLEYSAGVMSDIYIGSRIKSNDNLSYVGLNSDCFNRASLAAFIEMGYSFNRIRIGGRMGWYITPQLNPDKIAYYNQCKTYVDGKFWEVKLSWRIFTSGSHYSTSLLDF